MRRRFKAYHSRGNFRNNRFPQNRNAAADRQIIQAIRAHQETVNSDKFTQDEDYVPTNKFEDFQISEQLKRNISYQNFILPTPIQDQVIPVALLGRDVIGIANTGTGKTAAFLIPLIEKAHKDRSQKILIISPTRELAMQIRESFKLFVFGMKIDSALPVGGENSNSQRNELRRSPQFVIGTPGRIRDFVRQGVLHLSEFNNIVLDEADRMVDLGFIDDINFFIAQLTKIRQSLFFSATIPPKVETILKSFVKDPVTISVKKSENLTNIKQEMVRVENIYEKVEKLHSLLIREEFIKVLIFGRTKRSVQRLADELVDRGFRAGALHGDKRQSQRKRIIDEFKKDRIKILIATDVASRGLDIDNVSHVINFDMPQTYEDYIHRIGRTGRSNKKGTALTFFN